MRKKNVFFFFRCRTDKHGNAVGGGNSVRYCGSSCGVATAPASRSPQCPVQTGDPIDTQVRWGQSATTGNPYAQSGMGFTGEKGIDVPLNREWFCGRLTHFNHPISGPASSTQLNIQLTIPEFAVQQDFSFTLDIDETTNSVASGPCPYQSTTPCSDKITFNVGGLDVLKKFKIGRVEYTLQLTGFKESRSSTSLPTDRFISNEHRENNAFLFARIVAACPAACVGGGEVTLIVENGLKTCGCNCGSKQCTPPQLLGKDCGCACPPGTCNGAPTQPGTCSCNCPRPADAGLTCMPPKSGWDTTRCECKCDDNLCGAGTLVDPGSCKCDCAAVTCTNGRVPNPAQKCQCECLAQCGPTQRLETDNGRCECVCDPTKTSCAAGFQLEIDPTNPSKCRCGCANVCGAGCGAAGSAKQCNDGAAEVCCKSCQFQPNSCDDNNKCTKDDKCDVGASIAAGTSVCKGEPKCPTAPDVCTTYTCNPATGDCSVATRADGEACGATGTDPQTWDLCSFECRGGRCVGKTVTCDQQQQMLNRSSCDSYSCNPRTGQCAPGPKPGKTCNDENSCTFNDVCKDVGGTVVCQGEQNTCGDKPKVQCHTWQCLAAAGECVKVPEPFNTVCGGDGSDACKLNGYCSGGVCLFKRKCERLLGEDGYCQESYCDPMTGQCLNKTRAEGSACILDNGRPRGSDFCGGNYSCLANGTCKGDILPERVNHSNCTGVVVVDQGAGGTAALVVGLSAAAAVLVMILLAGLLAAFINRSKLTDPTTWGNGRDGALENNPIYDQSAGGQSNPLYSN